MGLSFQKEKLNQYLIFDLLPDLAGICKPAGEFLMTLPLHAYHILLELSR
jgi:hypothetical protein